MQLAIITTVVTALFACGLTAGTALPPDNEKTGHNEIDSIKTDFNPINNNTTNVVLPIDKKDVDTKELVTELPNDVPTSIPTDTTPTNNPTDIIPATDPITTTNTSTPITTTNTTTSTTTPITTTTTTPITTTTITPITTTSTTPITTTSTTPITTTTTTPITTTTTTPITTTTTTPTTTTQIPLTTAKPEPGPCHRFDAPSFIGGIILTVGLMAIAFVILKYVRTRSEQNYHTL